MRVKKAKEVGVAEPRKGTEANAEMDRQNSPWITGQNAAAFINSP